MTDVSVEDRFTFYLCDICGKNIDEEERMLEAGAWSVLFEILGFKLKRYKGERHYHWDCFMEGFNA